MRSTLFFISLLINLLFLIAFFFALNKYGGWKNLWAKINSRGIEKTYAHRKNLFELMPEQDSTIVFLGNSITAYGEWSELFANSKVLNRGIPGDHCDGVRMRLDEVVKLQPCKLFLLIGVNDLAYHPPEVVLGKYENLLIEILKKFPETEIYVQSLFPVNNDVSPTAIENADIVMLNKGIAELAKNFEIPLIDLFPILQDGQGNLDAMYTSDGLHINGAAYLKWAQFLSDIINDDC